MTAMAKWVIILGAVGFASLSFAASSDDWEKAALRLSGESDRVYQASLKRLKNIPHLNEKLLAALPENSTRTFLALDVISALRGEELLPAVVKAAENDSSGFFYLAINTFIDGAHAKFISDLYLERLKNRSTSLPAKMVLIDTLGRLRVKISESELKLLLKNTQEPEVQNAALEYQRKLGPHP